MEGDFEKQARERERERERERAGKGKGKEGAVEGKAVTPRPFVGSRCRIPELTWKGRLALGSGCLSLSQEPHFLSIRVPPGLTMRRLEKDKSNASNAQTTNHSHAHAKGPTVQVHANVSQLKRHTLSSIKSLQAYLQHVALLTYLFSWLFLRRRVRALSGGMPA